MARALHSTSIGKLTNERGNVQKGDDVSDKRKEQMNLSTIAVTSRAAGRHAQTPRDRRGIADRTHKLLANLESEVIRDGADERILAEIERERRRAFEGSPDG